jgi:hypothetical protein
MRNLMAGPALALVLTLGIAPPLRAAEVVTPSRLSMTQSVVTLAAGVDTVLGSSASRRYLCLMNIGTGLVSLGFGRTAVADSGWALEGASADGHQGGSMCWEASVVMSSVVHAISAAGSTVVVLEGQ